MIRLAWDQLFPAEQIRIVRLLVEQVTISPNDMQLRLRPNGIERLALELHDGGHERQQRADSQVAA